LSAFYHHHHHHHLLRFSGYSHDLIGHEKKTTGFTLNKRTSVVYIRRQSPPASHYAFPPPLSPCRTREPTWNTQYTQTQTQKMSCSSSSHASLATCENIVHIMYYICTCIVYIYIFLALIDSVSCWRRNFHFQ
jgi:hypothetical protein